MRNRNLSFGIADFVTRTYWLPPTPTWSVWVPDRGGGMHQSDPPEFAAEHRVFIPQEPYRVDGVAG